MIAYGCRPGHVCRLRPYDVVLVVAAVIVVMILVIGCNGHEGEIDALGLSTYTYLATYPAPN